MRLVVAREAPRAIALRSLGSLGRVGEQHSSPVGRAFKSSLVSLISSDYLLLPPPAMRSASLARARDKLMGKA